MPWPAMTRHERTDPDPRPSAAGAVVRPRRRGSPAMGEFSHGASMRVRRPQQRRRQRAELLRLDLVRRIAPATLLSQARASSRLAPAPVIEGRISSSGTAPT